MQDKIIPKVYFTNTLNNYEYELINIIIREHKYIRLFLLRENKVSIIGYTIIQFYNKLIDCNIKGNECILYKNRNNTVIICKHKDLSNLIDYMDAYLSIYLI